MELELQNAEFTDYARGIAGHFRRYHDAFEEFLRALKQTLQDG